MLGNGLRARAHSLGRGERLAVVSFKAAAKREERGDEPVGEEFERLLLARWTLGIKRVGKDHQLAVGGADDIRHSRGDKAIATVRE